MNYTDIKDKIKPAEYNKNDKYLLRLFKFVTKFEDKGEKVFVLKTPSNPNGDIFKATIRNIIIGDYMENNIIGCTVRKILSSSKGNYLFSSYTKEQLVERTEEFWNGYIEKGKCFLEQEHGHCFSGDRWNYIDDCNRVCKWCGLTQHKETFTVEEEQHKWTCV